MRGLTAGLAAVAAVPLGGCVASLAAGAVGAVSSAVAKSGAPKVDPNVDVGQSGRSACTERAAKSGEVHVIDVEARGPGKAIVWGTVGEGAQRRSFECRYAGKIVGFTLRAIGQAR